MLTARPYAYLDDAPLEERRTQAVMSRRWLDPETSSELGHLDAAAILRVREEAWPDAANADELHDAMVWLGFLTEAEAASPGTWEPMARRAGASAARHAVEKAGWWNAVRRGRAAAAFPDAVA